MQQQQQQQPEEESRSAAQSLAISNRAVTSVNLRHTPLLVGPNVLIRNAALEVSSSNNTGVQQRHIHDFNTSNNTTIQRTRGAEGEATSAVAAALTPTPTKHLLSSSRAAIDSILKQSAAKSRTWQHVVENAAVATHTSGHNDPPPTTAIATRTTAIATSIEDRRTRAKPEARLSTESVGTASKDDNTDLGSGILVKDKSIGRDSQSVAHEVRRGGPPAVASVDQPTSGGEPSSTTTVVTSTPQKGNATTVDYYNVRTLELFSFPEEPHDSPAAHTTRPVLRARSSSYPPVTGGTPIVSSSVAGTGNHLGAAATTGEPSAAPMGTRKEKRGRSHSKLLQMYAARRLQYSLMERTASTTTTENHEGDGGTNKVVEEESVHHVENVTSFVEDEDRPLPLAAAERIEYDGEGSAQTTEVEATTKQNSLYFDVRNRKSLSMEDESKVLSSLPYNQRPSIATQEGREDDRALLSSASHRSSNFGSAKSSNALDREAEKTVEGEREGEELPEKMRSALRRSNSTRIKSEASSTSRSAGAGLKIDSDISSVYSAWSNAALESDSDSDPDYMLATQARFQRDQRKQSELAALKMKRLAEKRSNSKLKEGQEKEARTKRSESIGRETKGGDLKVVKQQVAANGKGLKQPQLSALKSGGVGKGGKQQAHTKSEPPAFAVPPPPPHHHQTLKDPNAYPIHIPTPSFSSRGPSNTSSSANSPEPANPTQHPHPTAAVHVVGEGGGSSTAAAPPPAFYSLAPVVLNSNDDNVKGENYFHLNSNPAKSTLPIPSIIISGEGDSPTFTALCPDVSFVEPSPDPQRVPNPPKLAQVTNHHRGGAKKENTNKNRTSSASFSCEDENEREHAKDNPTSSLPSTEEEEEALDKMCASGKEEGDYDNCESIASSSSSQSSDEDAADTDTHETSSSGESEVQGNNNEIPEYVFTSKGKRKKNPEIARAKRRLRLEQKKIRKAYKTAGLSPPPSPGLSLGGALLGAAATKNSVRNNSYASFLAQGRSSFLLTGDGTASSPSAALLSSSFLKQQNSHTQLLPPSNNSPLHRSLAHVHEVSIVAPLQTFTELDRQAHIDSCLERYREDAARIKAMLLRAFAGMDTEDLKEMMHTSKGVDRAAVGEEEGRHHGGRHNNSRSLIDNDTIRGSSRRGVEEGPRRARVDYLRRSTKEWRHSNASFIMKENEEDENKKGQQQSDSSRTTTSSTGTNSSGNSTGENSDAEKAALFESSHKALRALQSEGGMSEKKQIEHLLKNELDAKTARDRQNGTKGSIDLSAVTPPTPLKVIPKNDGRPLSRKAFRSAEEERKQQQQRQRNQNDSHFLEKAADDLSPINRASSAARQEHGKHRDDIDDTFVTLDLASSKKTGPQRNNEHQRFAHHDEGKKVDATHATNNNDGDDEQNDKEEEAIPKITLVSPSSKASSRRDSVERTTSIPSNRKAKPPSPLPDSVIRQLIADGHISRAEEADATRRRRETNSTDMVPSATIQYNSAIASRAANNLSQHIKNINASKQSSSPPPSMSTARAQIAESLNAMFSTGPDGQKPVLSRRSYKEIKERLMAEAMAKYHTVNTSEGGGGRDNNTEKGSDEDRGKEERTEPRLPATAANVPATEPTTPTRATLADKRNKPAPNLADTHENAKKIEKSVGVTAPEPFDTIRNASTPLLFRSDGPQGKGSASVTVQPKAARQSKEDRLPSPPKRGGGVDPKESSITSPAAAPKEREERAMANEENENKKPQRSTSSPLSKAALEQLEKELIGGYGSPMPSHTHDKPSSHQEQHYYPSSPVILLTRSSSVAQWVEEQQIRKLSPLLVSPSFKAPPPHLSSPMSSSTFVACEAAAATRGKTQPQPSLSAVAPQARAVDSVPTPSLVSSRTPVGKEAKDVKKNLTVPAPSAAVETLSSSKNGKGVDEKAKALGESAVSGDFQCVADKGDAHSGAASKENEERDSDANIRKKGQLVENAPPKEIKDAEKINRAAANNTQPLQYNVDKQKLPSDMVAHSTSQQTKSGDGELMDTAQKGKLSTTAIHTRPDPLKAQAADTHTTREASEWNNRASTIVVSTPSATEIPHQNNAPRTPQAASPSFKSNRNVTNDEKIDSLRPLGAANDVNSNLGKPSASVLSSDAAVTGSQTVSVPFSGLSQSTVAVIAHNPANESGVKSAVPETQDVAEVEAGASPRTSDVRPAQAAPFSSSPPRLQRSSPQPLVGVSTRARGNSGISSSTNVSASSGGKASEDLLFREAPEPEPGEENQSIIQLLEKSLALTADTNEGFFDVGMLTEHGPTATTRGFVRPLTSTQVNINGSDFERNSYTLSLQQRTSDELLQVVNDEKESGTNRRHDAEKSDLDEQEQTSIGRNPLEDLGRALSFGKTKDAPLHQKSTFRKRSFEENASEDNLFGSAGENAHHQQVLHVVVSSEPEPFRRSDASGLTPHREDLHPPPHVTPPPFARVDYEVNNTDSDATGKGTGEETELATPPTPPLPHAPALSPPLPPLSPRPFKNNNNNNGKSEEYFGGDSCPRTEEEEYSPLNDHHYYHPTKRGEAHGHGGEEDAAVGALFSPSAASFSSSVPEPFSRTPVAAEEPVVVGVVWSACDVHDEPEGVGPNRTKTERVNDPIATRLVFEDDESDGQAIEEPTPFPPHFGGPDTTSGVGFSGYHDDTAANGLGGDFGGADLPPSSAPLELPLSPRGGSIPQQRLDAPRTTRIHSSALASELSETDQTDGDIESTNHNGHRRVDVATPEEEDKEEKAADPKRLSSGSALDKKDAPHGEDVSGSDVPNRNPSRPHRPYSSPMAYHHTHFHRNKNQLNLQPGTCIEEEIKGTPTFSEEEPVVTFESDPSNCKGNTGYGDFVCPSEASSMASGWGRPVDSAPTADEFDRNSVASESSASLRPLVVRDTSRVRPPTATSSSRPYHRYHQHSPNSKAKPTLTVASNDSRRETEDLMARSSPTKRYGADHQQARAGESGGLKDNGSFIAESESANTTVGTGSAYAAGGSYHGLTRSTASPADAAAADKAAHQYDSQHSANYEWRRGNVDESYSSSRQASSNLNYAHRFAKEISSSSSQSAATSVGTNGTFTSTSYSQRRFADNTTNSSLNEYGSRHPKTITSTELNNTNRAHSTSLFGGSRLLQQSNGGLEGDRKNVVPLVNPRAVLEFSLGRAKLAAFETSGRADLRRQQDVAWKAIRNQFEDDEDRIMVRSRLALRDRRPSQNLL